jgi:hypothetical protein
MFGDVLRSFSFEKGAVIKVVGRVWFGFFLTSLSEKLAVGKSWWLEFRCLVRQLCRKVVRENLRVWIIKF